MSSDADLLRRFACEQDEAAFAELVHRRLDLVYSAALRRVGGDTHAAAEVAQQVFHGVARHARKLADHPVLSAWLHAATRNAAANFRRGAERHERRKERMQAMQEIPSSENGAADWEDIRGVLDAALDELGEADRRALVLRFFESQSYAAIAASIGGREEAARMRVTRALERLRERLARRGVMSSAALLGGALSANAITAAPAGLAASISSSAAGAAGVSVTIGTFTLMSLPKVSAAAVAVAIVAAVGVITWRRAESRFNPPSRQPAATVPMIRDADRRATNLAALVNATAASAATLEAEEKIAALREVLRRLPEQSIPELKLATNGDWHMAVDGKLETADDYRRALSKLRTIVEARFAKLTQPALQAFLRVNKNQFPSDVAELQPFAPAEIDSAMLRRYRVAPSSEIANVRMGGGLMITQDHLIDTEYDNHLVIGPNGFGTLTSQFSAVRQEYNVLQPVVRAYRAVNGRAPGDLNDAAQWRELLPFTTTPEQRAVVEKRIEAATPR